MTRPHAIIGSAMATAATNILVVVAIILAMSSEGGRIEPHQSNDSRPLFQLSPIPAGADWGRS